MTQYAPDAIGHPKVGRRGELAGRADEVTVQERVGRAATLDLEPIVYKLMHPEPNALTSLLRTHEDGSPNFAVRTITQPSHSITRSSLRAALGELFSDHDEADVALFYFSGHGTENNLGGFIVTPDAKVYDEGVSLTDVLTLANKAKARECVIILDSCHSGHLGLDTSDRQRASAPSRGCINSYCRSRCPSRSRGRWPRVVYRTGLRRASVL